MPRTPAAGSVPTPAQRGKARAVLERLKQRYPTIHTALSYDNPWQLLVSTVLSAQTTDDNVNRITPTLFARYPTPEALAGAGLEEVEKLIYSSGYYRQKARAIVELSADLVEKFGGVVPADLDQLVTLPGVGRKTASVVLAEAFGIPAVAVDTHVRRVTQRLGLTTQTDPDRIELDLRALYPESEWAELSMRIIQFGRDTCLARAPRCFECELVDLCSYPDKRL